VSLPKISASYAGTTPFVEKRLIRNSQNIPEQLYVSLKIEEFSFSLRSIVL